VLFASDRIFLKPSRQSNRGAAPFKVEICAVIDEGSKREPPAHEGPGSMDAKRALVELLRSIIRQFDSERADEGARRECEDRGKDNLRQTCVETERRTEEG
jgi:hypothetical protein